MHGSITARCSRLALAAAAGLALTIAPYRIALHGSTPAIDAATAQAAKGGNGGGNSGNGNGNGGSNGGSSSGGNGNGNSGNGNGNGGSSGSSSGGNGNGNGNSGNGNGNGGSSGNGNGNSGNGNGNSGGSGTDSGGNGTSASGKDQGASHVNTATGDKVDVSGNQITVTHPDGITEKIENGRFRMQDAQGRKIIDRRATPADVTRLRAM